ncbi:hypothetical protein QR685DRAFT_434745, partial [Neurospora intermedia]
EVFDIEVKGARYGLRVIVALAGVLILKIIIYFNNIVIIKRLRGTLVLLL